MIVSHNFLDTTKASDRSIYRHDNKRSFFPRASLYRITAIEKNPLASRCSHPLRCSFPLRRGMKSRRLQWSEEKFAAGARRSNPPQEGASVDLSRDSWWSLGLCRKNENEAEKEERRKKDSLDYHTTAQPSLCLHGLPCKISPLTFLRADKPLHIPHS